MNSTQKLKYMEYAHALYVFNPYLYSQQNNGEALPEGMRDTMDERAEEIERLVRLEDVDAIETLITSKEMAKFRYMLHPLETHPIIDRVLDYGDDLQEQLLTIDDSPSTLKWVVDANHSLRIVDTMLDIDEIIKVEDLLALDQSGLRRARALRDFILRFHIEPLQPMRELPTPE